LAKKRPGEDDAPALDQNGPAEVPEDDPAFSDLLKKIAQAPSIDPKAVTERASKAPQEDLSGKQLAHFQVLERIGEGGMGVIYRAIDERLKRTVALKVLPPRHAGDRERNARLWREAQNAAAVNHPHIASIYELGEAQGVSFIAMEYVAGKSLRSYAKGRPLLIGEAVHYARQVAEGLARAHEAGIVHRDLKPDNVMITPDRRVKILDFGLAKLMSSAAEPAPPPRASPAPSEDGAATASPTRDGVVLGTPVYMSPEQEKGEPKLDARADIYSFGVMLFEMLTGSPPARHGDPRAHLLYVLEGPGKDVDHSLVMPLEQVILRCIEPNPRDRYPNGAAVLEALRAVPISTGMDLPPVPFNVHTSNRQRFFWALAGLTVFLIGCIIAATYIHRYIVARDRRLAAEENLRKQARKPAERRLTFNTPEDPILDAALSPDAQVLAFVDMKGAHLRTLDPESTRPLKLPDTAPPPLSVTWMPSGKEVLLTARKPGDEESVLLAATLDGKVRELSRGKLSRPQVSPDGSLVAFVGPKGLQIAPLSLDHPRILVPKVPEEELSEVHWAPDGRRILYVHEIRLDEGTRVYLETVNIGTGQTQALLEKGQLLHATDSGAVVWAPDGRILFALAERPPSEPGFTLWSVTLDPTTGLPQTHARMLNSWIGSTPGMLSMAKGDITYARFEQQTDVYLLDLDAGGRASGQPRRLTMSERNERPSGWSPDGKSVLYVSDQDGSYDLFIQDVVTGDARKLLEDRNSQTWPSFTRQGFDVLYWDHPYPCDADTDVPARLMRAALPGGKPQEVLVERHTSGCQDMPSELPPSEAYFRCPARAGNCILGETEGLQIAFSVLDLKHNRAHEVTRVPNPGLQAHGWDISPDGTRLALPGASGQVRLVDLTRRKAFDQFVNKACELNAVAFTANGGGFYSTAECPGLAKPYKLYYSEGLRAPVVLWESSSMRFLTPVASPDGKRLAVGVRPFDNDVWMVSGL